MVLPVNPLARAKMDIAPSTAFPFTIREATGDSRMIVLRGRSLPFQGVSWPSEQRVNVKYFAGSPVGQAQVLGPKWLDTSVRGRWSDQWMSDPQHSVLLYNFPPIGAAGRPGTGVLGGKTFPSAGAVPEAKAQRARAVRDAFYLVQRAGQLLRVEWGSLVRYGFMRNFDPDHDREEDIHWEATFEWIGDTDAPPRVRPPLALDAPGILAAIVAALQAFLDAMNALLAQALGLALAIQQRITQIGQLVTGVINALTQIVNLVFVPADLLGTLRQQLTSVVLAVRDLLSTLRGIPAGMGATAAGGSPRDANLADEFAALLAHNTALLGERMVTLTRQLDELEVPEIIGVFTAPGDITLRDVANRFYGNPDGWQRIADYNDFASSIVPRGTLIRIPR